MCSVHLIHSVQEIKSEGEIRDFFSSRKDWYIAMPLYILRIHFPIQYHPYHFLRSGTSNPFTQNILFSKVESDDCGVDG